MSDYADLGAADRRAVDERFDREVYPVLTPLAVGPGLPFPYISGLSLNLGLRVRDPVKGETRFARVKVPPRLPRLIPVDHQLVFIEDVIEAHVERLFPGMELVEGARFRVTRDADFSISDESDDLIGAVEAQLRRRRFGHVVRLEVEEEAPDRLVRELMTALEVSDRETYRVRPPLDFTMLWALATMDRPDLRDPPWEPRTRPRLRPEEGDRIDLFAVIRDGDVLVHHPYDDFHTSVERFVEQAVEDPNVLAIKQTVYRTSGDSPIVPGADARRRAGQADRLPGRAAGALRRGAQHPVGAGPGARRRPRGLRDVGAEDARQGGAGGAPRGRDGAPLRPHRHRQLQPVDRPALHRPRASSPAARTWPRTSPTSSTTSPASPARRATARRWWRPTTSATASSPRSSASSRRTRPTSPSRVVMKMNSIIDGPVIRAIYLASQAGVRVDLIVRGIAGLRPGVPGVSENVRVISIVGRFLEHARVFAFTAGGETGYWIGSADMMARNLDNRVELVAPVEDPAARAEIQEILDLQLADTALAWELGPDGTWRGSSPSRAQAPLNSQEALMERASRTARLG